jgi:hypothetical protein
MRLDDEDTEAPFFFAHLAKIDATDVDFGRSAAESALGAGVSI